MRDRLPRTILVSLAVGLALTACAPAPGVRSAPATSRTGPVAHWVKFKHIPAVVDVANRGAEGSLFVAAAGRLFILSRGGALTPYARGPGGYQTALGPEPYIAATGSQRVAGTTCSFGSGTVFALQPAQDTGIIRIAPDGRASRFASVPRTGLLTGIAYDSTGHFGHALLVAHRSPGGSTTILAYDCTGRARAITHRAPALEGGLVVAPASFGRFRGDLIATDERNGVVFAIQPDGTVITLADSGLPHGGDIGVESAGFVPPGFGSGSNAYLADRFSRGNRHPGTNSLLRLSGPALMKAGVRAGDLLVATEGSARTIAVRCGRTCTVRYVAIGPLITHAEGHIVFVR